MPAIHAVHKLFQKVYHEGEWKHAGFCGSPGMFIEIMDTICKENILIPINHGETAMGRIKDHKGFRVLNYKLISGNELAHIYGMGHIQCKEFRIPFAPADSVSVMENSPSPYMQNDIEAYSQMLNVTYLVDDRSLHNFLYNQANFDEKNVAKKLIKECTIAELLFAIDKKLTKRGKQNE